VAGFRHEALLYAGDEEFVSEASAFLREGIAAGEPAVVVVAAPKIERLREALSHDADAVVFADMAAVGHNPARIIPVWREFVEAHAPSNGAVRGIGEPIGPDRGVDELAECHRHESLLNLAFVDAGSFWLLCPYDVAALDPAVIAHARRTHPYVARGGEREQSADYPGADAFRLPFEAPLRQAPGDAVGLSLEAAPLESMRRFVADYAERAGLVRGRVLDLVLAINEIATNSVRHGGGRGQLRIWSETGRLVCEIQDGGQLSDPLVDRDLPSVVEPGGRGFWIANQLCDLVQLRSGPAGTIVRLHMATR
jgi:anti-sigma regulatory factor (Ser/Thr protein kinase)